MLVSLTLELATLQFLFDLLLTPDVNMGQFLAASQSLFTFQLLEDFSDSLKLKQPAPSLPCFHSTFTVRHVCITLSISCRVCVCKHTLLYT